MATSNGDIDEFVPEEIVFDRLILVLDKINNNPNLKGIEYNRHSSYSFKKCFVFRICSLACSKRKIA